MQAVTNMQYSWGSGRHMLVLSPHILKYPLCQVISLVLQKWVMLLCVTYHAHHTGKHAVKLCTRWLEVPCIAHSTCLLWGMWSICAHVEKQWHQD